MNCIFDNIIFSLQKSGGISAYWFELMQRMLLSQDIKCRFIEDIEISKNNIFRKNLTISNNRIFNKKTTLFNRILPVNLEVSEKIIFHSSYYRIIKNKQAKIVTTVHDFINEMIHRNKISTSALMRKFAINNSDQFIAISNNTKFDFLNLFPNVSEDKITVIYNGVSDNYYHFSSPKSSDVDYIIFVGSRANYKNFDFVIKLVSKFETLKLYIVGGVLSYDEKILLSKNLNPDRWKLFLNVSNNELNILYNNASALVYPSLYEGFGIPVIEAMKAGCPVIALNRSSIPEISGDAGILLDKLDLADFYDAIKLSKKNKDFYVKKGIENASKFSWDTTFLETVKLYNKL